MNFDDDSSDDSESPTTIKMPDLLQRQKAESEKLTASLRADGILQGDEEATITFNERGHITAVFLDGLSAQHSENLARTLTAPKVHDHEKPEKRGPIKDAIIDDLSPVEFLDRQRKQRDKPKKARSESSPPVTR